MKFKIDQNLPVEFSTILQGKVRIRGGPTA
jgi:hypothetical protein